MCGNRHDLEVIGLVRRTRFGLFRCDKVLKAVPPWKRNAAVSNVIPRGNRSRRMKIFAVVCGTHLRIISCVCDSERVAIERVELLFGVRICVKIIGNRRNHV